MFTYKKIYHEFVNRTIHEYLKPKVILGTELVYPKDTMIFWFKASDDIEYISKQIPYFYTTHKPAVISITEYTKLAKYGNFKHINFKESKLISKLKRHESRMRFIKSDSKSLTINSNSEVIYNLASLNYFYKYHTDHLLTLHKWANAFLTLTQLVKNENTSNQRHKFIILDIPTVIPTYDKIYRYLETISPTELKSISEISTLNIIDIFRLLHSKYREKSLLAQIPYTEYENITLIFTVNGNVSLFNLRDLFSLNKKYNISSKLPSYDDNTVMKILVVLFNRISKTPGMLASDLFNADEFIEKAVEYKTDDLNDLDNLVEKFEDDNIVDENLKKKAIKKNEIEDIFKDIETDEVIETIKEEHIDELKEKIIEEEEDILEEINLLKDKKLITNTEYNNIKKILEEQNKKKPVYPELGKSIKEARKYNKNDFVVTEEDKKFKPSKAVLEKSMAKSSLPALDKKYLEKVYKKDLLNAIYGIQKNGILIQDHTVETKDSIMGKNEYHTIVIKPINGNRSTIKLVLPVINKDGTFKMSGNVYTLRKQKNDLPIRKFSNTVVGLSSYYGKVNVTKATYKKDDIGFFINKILVERFREGIVKSLVAVPVANIDVDLPNQYQIVARNTKSFTYKNTDLYFEYKTRIILTDNNQELLDKLETKDKILVGKKGKNYIFIDHNNILYIQDNGKLKELDTLFNYLDLPLNKMPVEYCNLKVFKHYIPVGVLLAYYIGFDSLLKITKVKYTRLETNKRYTLEDDEYFIKFSDYKYIIKKDYDKNDLIFGGFKSIEKVIKQYTKDVFNKKDQMTAVFNSLGLQVLHVNELDLLNRMFVDDITASILEELKLPTTFIGLLIKAIEMLADDNYKHPNDMSNMRFRGHERIAGMVYKELVNSIRIAENKSYFSKSKIEFNPYSILKKITEDSNVMLEDNLNPIAELKQKSDTSVTGEGGRSKETMSKITREVHPSEIGIISENSKDSGDVGVSGNILTANPSIKSVRGLVDVKDIKELTPANMLSPSALLAPFSTKDDMKRLNFIGIMNGHVVPINEMRVPYVRTGYEAIIPLMSSDKFVNIAEEDGVVEKVTKDYVTVKYKTLGVKKYKLREWNTKEESGATYVHKLVTSLKPKDKISKDDTITYDKFFYEPDVFDRKRVVIKLGTMINVAMKDIPQTYEDSGMLSKRLDKRMGLELTKVKSFILDKNIEIMNLINIGDKVKPNSPLFSMMDGSLVVDDKVDDRTMKILQDLKMSTPKAKYEGTVVNYKIYYNFDPKEASKSVQKAIKESDERLIERDGYPGRVDATYSVNGKKLLEDTFELKIYINVNEGMGLGDKAVLGNQLKFTVGEVYDYDIVTDDNREVELVFSYLSVAARIVNSPELIGTTSTLLEKVTNDVCDMYF